MGKKIIVTNVRTLIIDRPIQIENTWVVCNRIFTTLQCYMYTRNVFFKDNRGILNGWVFDNPQTPMNSFSEAL